MNLNERLPKIIRILKDHRARYESNETEVRNQIIDPILKSLDWDPSDPDSGVRVEINIESGKPDYILERNGIRILFIEAKSLNKKVEKK